MSRPKTDLHEFMTAAMEMSSNFPDELILDGPEGAAEAVVLQGLKQALGR